MREHAVCFGPGGSMSGILCEPDQPVPGAPAALMWNVGIHHRVGAYRVWVELARSLAAEGFSSLRFDLSGLGDSEPRRGASEDIARREDLDDAMAFVTKRTGIATFAPIAFCSGIDQLHALGLRDSRVVAMGYIEGYSWRTRGFYLRYPLRYLRGTLWRDRLEHLSERKALRRFRRFLKPREALTIDPGQAEVAAGATLQGTMFARLKPSRQQFANDVRALRDRKVKLFFAYFGLETDFLYEGQFEEMTGLEPSADVRLFFLGGADHILYRTTDRALTVGETTRWMKGAFA